MSAELVEVEIEKIDPLSERETTLVDNHSLLNVLNIVHGELSLLGIALEDDPDFMVEGQGLCREMIAGLCDSSLSLSCASRTDDYVTSILAEIARLQSRHPERSEDSEIGNSVDNIRSLLRVWSVRAHEILARAGHPMRWEAFGTHELSENFGQVFTAIARNSRGRFSFVEDRAQWGPTNYLIDLRFEPARGSSLEMPPVLVDVMRDLIANARKYTAPGGAILARLLESESGLDFVVQDTGRGIAENELRSVVEFGVRGSNVSDIRSMGGGFGLTKAFLVTRRFGGKFCLASRLGVGTRVRLTLARPGCCSAAMDEDQFSTALSGDSPIAGEGTLVN